MTARGYTAQIVRPIGTDAEVRRVIVGRSINEKDASERVEAYVDRINKEVSEGPLWSLEVIEPLSIEAILYSGSPVEIGDFTSQVKVVVKMVQASNEEAERFARLPDIDPGWDDDDFSDEDPCEYCEDDDGTHCAYCAWLWM